MNSQNPLIQYFRRPVIHFKLPSGYKNYEVGVIDVPETGELPVYPMTAIDEITVRTPDALFNGSAIADIISSCIPAIKNPWKLNNIDIDAILVAIRISTHGSEMAIDTTCPSCNEGARYNVPLTDVLNKFDGSGYNKPLKVGDLEFMFRPLNFKEVTDQNNLQFTFQKTIVNIERMEDGEQKEQMTAKAIKDINDMTVSVIASTIGSITTPTARVTERGFILEFLQNCDAHTFEQVKTASFNTKKGTQIPPLSITCPHCQHKYEQTFTVNAADFFG